MAARKSVTTAVDPRQAAALAHLDSVLRHSHYNVSYAPDVVDVEQRCMNAIRAWAPRGTVYREAAEQRWRDVSKWVYDPKGERAKLRLTTGVESLLGTVQALRRDIEGGWIGEAEVRVRVDTLGGLLGVADSLMAPEDGPAMKDPAAAIAGVVLEAHIRRLAEANHLEGSRPDGRRKKAEDLNGDLRAAGIIDLLDLKSITTWLQIRNYAVHAEWDKFNEGQVDLMLRGVRDFIARFPA